MWLQVREVCSNLVDKTAGSGDARKRLANHALTLWFAGLVKSAAVGALGMVGRMFGKKAEEVWCMGMCLRPVCRGAEG